MKYLKQLSAILLGRCGVNLWKTRFEDYTTTLVGTVISEDGKEEQLCGIYVTRQQLEQLRHEINRYLNYLDTPTHIDDTLDSAEIVKETEEQYE